MSSIKKNKPGQTNWTTGFKSKLDVANTSLYTKFELFSSMCPHIGGLIFLSQIFPIFASFSALLALYKSMGKIFKLKILYFLLQNCNLHQILDWETYHFLYFGKLFIFTLLATKCKSKLEQCHILYKTILQNSFFFCARQL